MRTSGRKAWFAAFAIAIAILVLGSLTGSTVSFIVTYPGLLFTWPFWPEGIHSGAGGVASAVCFYVVFALGNIVAWAAIVRVVILLTARLRAHPVAERG